MSTKKITAVFAVHAGTTGEAELDVTGMSVDEMAEAIEDAADAYASVCHQCSHTINDPAVGEMVAFTVDGVDYHRPDGTWVRADVD